MLEEEMFVKLPIQDAEYLIKQTINRELATFKRYKPSYKLISCKALDNRPLFSFLWFFSSESVNQEKLCKVFEI